MNAVMWLAVALVVGAGEPPKPAAPAEAGKPAAAADASKPAASAATDKAPRIAVEPAGFDFGRVLQQKTLEKEFKIRNFGTTDLLIDGVSTTCGCTAALLDNKVVKPGGSAPMKVTLQTRSSDGKLVRSVLVRSNDPAKPTLEIKVEAVVVPEAHPAPAK